MEIFLLTNYRRHVAALSMFVLMSIGSASAQSKDPSSSEWLKTSATATVGLAIGFGLRFVDTPICYWCNTNRFDENISRAWVHENRSRARIGSDIITFGFVPLFSFGCVALSSAWSLHTMRDAMVVIASSASSVAITELTKITARRARPEAFFGYSALRDENNRSFLSGHTSFAFSLLTSSTFIVAKKKPTWLPSIAGISAILGISVGYSRIAAAKHWMTDVLAGMALGITMGLIVPWLVLDSDDDKASVFLMPDIRAKGINIGMDW